MEGALTSRPATWRPPENQRFNIVWNEVRGNRSSMTDAIKMEVYKVEVFSGTHARKTRPVASEK